MTLRLDPREWVELHDSNDMIEHVEWCRENGSWPRLNMFQTDDGWAVEVTIRTAGAVSSVSATYMLSETVSVALDEVYQDAEDMIIFDGGLGVQVEL